MDEEVVLANWCRRELGAVPVRELFSTSAMSSVMAVELLDGRAVVIKRRLDEQGRAERCVRIQAAVAADGFPCPRPLTGVTVAAGMAVHAEEWVPGGTVMRRDDRAAARLSAVLLADLMAVLLRVEAEPPVPNPEWVRWDHADGGTFPHADWSAARAAVVPIPSWLDQAAKRVRARLLRVDLPRVIGHLDWEAQNLRWHGEAPLVVHDWDSLGYLPEAAVAGAAAGAFASTEIPSLAPLESSAAFLDAYQERRGCRFAPAETSVSWAASLWPALHNARGEILYDKTAVATTALRTQLDARLELADA